MNNLNKVKILVIACTSAFFLLAIGYNLFKEEKNSTFKDQTVVYRTGVANGTSDVVGGDNTKAIVNEGSKSTTSKVDYGTITKSMTIKKITSGCGGRYSRSCVIAYLSFLSDDGVEISCKTFDGEVLTDIMLTSQSMSKEMVLVGNWSFYESLVSSEKKMIKGLDVAKVNGRNAQISLNCGQNVEYSNPIDAQ